MDVGTVLDGAVLWTAGSLTKWAVLVTHLRFSTAPLRRSTMLWTVISQADVFYQAAQGSGRPAQ